MLKLRLKMFNTKEKILQKSLELFNTKGCLSTSNRAIAKEMGISIGNFYYYFKNKEEIVIELFLRYLEKVFKDVINLNYEKDEIFLLKQFLLDNLEVEIEYRFIHLEMDQLVNTFPTLKKIIQEQLKNEIQMITSLIEHQIKYEYIKPLNKEEIEFFVSNIWIVTCSNFLFWNLHDYDIYEVTKKAALNKYYLIKPYLTKKSLDNENIKDIEKVLKDKK